MKSLKSIFMFASMLLILGNVFAFSNMTQNQIEGYGLENIAIGKPVTVSSNFSADFPAANTVDGNPNTVWGTQHNATGNEWIFIDLEKVTPIRGLRLNWFQNYYASKYQIAISNDLKNWVFVHKSVSGTAAPLELIAGQSANCRYIGVLFIDGPKKIYAVSEFEILADSATPTPTATMTATPTQTQTQTPTPTIPYTAKLSVEWTTTAETDTDFTGTLTIKNPNSSYAWNGTCFDVWNIGFETTGTITSASGGKTFTQDGNNVALDLTWESFLTYDKMLEVTIKGTKAGNNPLPHNFEPNYVRGKLDELQYTDFQGLPSTWKKNSTSVSLSDLIGDSASYYQTTVPPIQDLFFVYNEIHPTQLQLCQKEKLEWDVSNIRDVRVHIPTKYMAMGLAYVYEWLKINPNFMTALSVKENLAAALIPPYIGGYESHPEFTIDGTTYNWGMLPHGDGPYQQEAGNFGDAKKIFPDLLGNIDHSTSIGIDYDLNNLNWISAGICSGLSITVTRENLMANRVQFRDFINQAKDPLAEFVCVDYAYNRGLPTFLMTGILTTRRDEALQTDDICTHFGIGGFGSHVENVREVTKELNNDVSDIYDAEVTWAEMESFLTVLRKFYSQGEPSDAEWNAMKADVQRAFNLLAGKWDGSHISIRYDFLTLLRVVKQHLPYPYVARPTGDHWYYLIKNGPVWP